MRVCVYIDGFNLYYRALKHSRHKWINLVEVAKRLLNPDDTVEMVRYFTARVSPRAGDPEAPRRQQILFSALATLPEIRFHYGKFLAKSKTRPLAGVKPLEFVEIMDTEEKGSDVNLAVHLLNDGWHKRYDAALVLSQDTDLVEHIRIVKEELGLVVGLVWLDGGNPSKYLRNASSFVRHLNPSDLAACQFTNPVMRPNGTAIHKPSSW